MKSAFVSTLSYITLSIITTIALSPLVLAHPGKIALNSPENSTNQLISPELVNSRVEKLAQFRGTLEEERSQLIQQAKTLSSQGDFTGAEENLRQLIKKFPRYAFGHFELGNVLFRQDKAEEAINAYREAIRFNSNHALAYNGIGLVYASQGRWEEAITAYQKALEINPKYADALANSAVALLQSNQQSEGIAALEKALDIFKTQSRNERVFQIEQILQKLKTLDEPELS
ncbi:tetratricopeptide repeat protein [Nodularia sphaerocarpa]|uniref:tetratricopeptide repeat protein n=1 Tax=Nodularia sphaerocarpa TaxID=137816 RepID=UPI001EFA9CD8|nr:tetratricopeptide repeat protein [Nodularia sphaerocarpa]MDB9372594.1 tetratricopeptide repeat protein [Nodularia sphaerocarpa CS-585]MDB9379621.1 tetratricopeptide repeat protein [Nodularia sphaerocarpa CS-585A2]ULP71099.1 Photosystem I assembly protein Ycf3 [Nodularia sphaerocarpa UHCC 0038]